MQGPGGCTWRGSLFTSLALSFLLFGCGGGGDDSDQEAALPFPNLLFNFANIGAFSSLRAFFSAAPRELGRLQMTRQYLLLCAFLTGFAWTTTGICSEGTSLRTFSLPSGITVSVPNSWVVAEDRDLRKYEHTRDRILEEKGVKQDGRAHVPFQARRRLADATGSFMFSLLPPVASQDDVAAWTPARIEKLGKLLGDGQKRALGAAGCSEIEALPAAIRTVGGKAAVAFELRFVCPNGVRYVAEKFYIYAQDKTVVVSFQFNESAVEVLRNDRMEILRALKIE